MVREEITKMDEPTLIKEIFFAEGFGPPTNPEEASWLQELRDEVKARNLATPFDE